MGRLVQFAKPRGVAPWQSRDAAAVGTEKVKVGGIERQAGAVARAEGMLYLNAVRAAQLALYTPVEAVGTAAAGAEDGGEVAARGCLHAAAVVFGKVAAARRLADYELKAISGRNGLIRCLDYLTLEARRRAS
jgi:hypothetical protein